MKHSSSKKRDRKYYLKRAAISFIASILIFNLPVFLGSMLFDKETNGYISMLSMLLAAGCLILCVVSLFRSRVRQDEPPETEPSVPVREPSIPVREPAAIQGTSEVKIAQEAVPYPQPEATAEKTPESRHSFDPELLAHPALDTAMESGPIGAGGVQRIQESAQELRIVHNATEDVKYYYFSEGLLVFSGRGATKAVDPGGYDGRTAYIPEDAPWSDTVCNGARRLIVIWGVTSIGAGLLHSLRNLEEITLADSVREIDYNDCPGVHTLRIGQGFESCELTSGDLCELVLPTHRIHIGSINSGEKLKLRSTDPEIQAKLIKNIKLEFAGTMAYAFPLPAVRIPVIRLGWADTDFALRQLALMKWNGRYGNKAVPEEDLWKIFGLSPDIPSGTELEITLSYQYGIHSIVQLGALVLLVVRKQPSALSVHVGSSLRLPDTEVLRSWWQKVAPQVGLRFLKLPDDELLFESKASSSASRPEPQPPKQKSVPDSPHVEIVSASSPYFDKVAQIQLKGWLQLDYQLTSRYGYNTMLKCIRAAVDFAKHVDKLWTAGIIGAAERDCTEAFREANCDPYSCSATQNETGVISIAGAFEGLNAPAKLVLINQTNILRIFLLAGKAEDRTQADAFVEELLDAATKGAETIVNEQKNQEK